MNDLISYTSSKKIAFCLVLFAYCLLPGSAEAQVIIPKRDIQRVDSLNRTRAIVPLTVDRRGYALISREDGYYYHEKLAPFLQDSLTNEPDSVFTLPPDTICVVSFNDTICVSQDSIINNGDSLCVIQNGDTTCVPLGQFFDTNLANTELTNEMPRTFWLNDFYLRFIQASSLNGFQILPLSSQRMTAIQVNGNTANNRGLNQAALEINNTQISGTERNAYIRYLNGTNIYSMGQDLTTPQGFTFSDSSNLKNPVWKYHSPGPSGGTAGDSLVFFKRTKFRSTLLDREGDAGSSGQILSATGTGVNWISSSSLTVPINGLLAATGTNTINNGNFAQEWQWNTLTQNHGLKISSTSSGTEVAPHKLFEVSLSGSNTDDSSVESYAGYFSNTQTADGDNYPAGLYVYGSDKGIRVETGGSYALWAEGTGGAGGIIGLSNSGDGVQGASVSGGGIFGTGPQYGVRGAASAGPAVWSDGRFWETQGTDVASVAGAISLPFNGNTFEITGTNAITRISNVGWQNGSSITLIFTSTASLTDGTANSGTDIGMELANNLNFSATADDVVTLILCEIGGVQRWREQFRTTN